MRARESTHKHTDHTKQSQPHRRWRWHACIIFWKLLTHTSKQITTKTATKSVFLLRTSKTAKSCGPKTDREKESKPHRRRRITFKDRPHTAIPNIYETNRIEIKTTTTKKKDVEKMKMKKPSFANRQNEMFVEWFLTYHLSFEFCWCDWLCVCERFFVAFFSCFGPCCCCCFFDFSFRHRTKNRYHTKFVYLSRSSLLISSMLSVYLFMFLLHVFFSVHCLGQHMITEISFSPPLPTSLSRSLFGSISFP